MHRFVDYRVVLLAVFLGVLATVGVGLSPGVGLLVFAGALLTGTAITALPARRTAPALPGGRTVQGRQLAAIEQAVGRLDELTGSDLVPAVRAKADEAAALGHSALATARTVARATDQIDAAIQQLAHAGRRADDAAVARLQRRRQALLQRLTSTADQLLDVYANLVETNATLATSTLGEGEVAAGDTQALAAVATSLDDLRVIAADLEASGQQELPPAGGPTG